MKYDNRRLYLHKQSQTHVAEQLVVFGVALLGAELRHFVPVEVRHQGLGGGQAVGARPAVFSPQLPKLDPVEETAAWQRREREETGEVT